jgi:predicted Zn-dependent protease
MTALLVAGLFGDLSSIAGLSAALPTFLVQQKYTRKFEREANAYAAETLRARGISAVHLANILKRLFESGGRSQSSLLDHLSSHPLPRNASSRSPRVGRGHSGPAVSQS